MRPNTTLDAPDQPTFLTGLDGQVKPLDPRAVVGLQGTYDAVAPPLPATTPEALGMPRHTAR